MTKKYVKQLGPFVEMDDLSINDSIALLQSLEKEFLANNPNVINIRASFDCHNNWNADRAYHLIGDRLETDLEYEMRLGVEKSAEDRRKAEELNLLAELKLKHPDA